MGLHLQIEYATSFGSRLGLRRVPAVNALQRSDDLIERQLCHRSKGFDILGSLVQGASRAVARGIGRVFGHGAERAMGMQSKE